MWKDRRRIPGCPNHGLGKALKGNLLETKGLLPLKSGHDRPTASNLPSLHRKHHQRLTNMQLSVLGSRPTKIREDSALISWNDVVYTLPSFLCESRFLYE